MFTIAKKNLLNISLMAAIILIAFTCGPTTPSFADQSAVGIQEIATVKSYQTDIYSGKASFAIPIALPPGRVGMQPNVTMQYYSGAGNGWCGVGWTLDLGSIQRNTKNGTPKYNSSDEFFATINGAQEELVQVKYSTTEYKAEINAAFRKYVFNGVYWEVWEKNGTKYLFGSTDSSRLTNAKGTFKWCLDKIIDTHGNYITMQYQHDYPNGQIYPEKIKYTGNEDTGDLPWNEVNFKFDPTARTDCPPSYRSGYKIVTAQRLKEVEVKSEGALVRAYVFDYEYAIDTHRSLLTRVSFYGRNRKLFTKPLIFSYYQNGTIKPTPSGTWGTFEKDQDWPYDDFIYWVPIAFDYDFDGPTDATMYYVSGDLWSGNRISYHIALLKKRSSQSAFQSEANERLSSGIKDLEDFDPRVVVGDFGKYGSREVLTVFADETWCGVDEAIKNKWEPLSGDFNGDSKADKAAFKKTEGKLKIELSVEDGSSSAYMWLDNFARDKDLLTGDFNGDGYCDAASFDKTSGRWEVAISNGRGFLLEGVWLTNFGQNKNPITADFNGDGLTDAGFFDSSNGTWCIAISNGTGFIVESGEWLTNFGIGDNWIPQLGDFNADGLADAAICNKNSGEWKVAVSNGLPFNPIATVSAPSGGNIEVVYKTYVGEYDDIPFPILIVDYVNKHDGMGNIYTTFYEHSRAYYYKSKRELRGFDYAKVIDSTGKRIEYTFSPLGKPEEIKYVDSSGFEYLKIEQSWGGSILRGMLKTQNYTNEAGNLQQLKTAEKYAYDDYNNITEHVQYGKVLNASERHYAYPSGFYIADTGEDYRTTQTVYAYNTNAWIIDKPYETTLQNNAKVLSKTIFFHSLNEGDLIEKRNWLEDPINETTSWVYTDYRYDNYGNLWKTIDDNDHWSEIEYDNTYHTFPERAINYKGHATETTYDVKTGNVISSIDSNGQTTHYEYDEFERLIAAYGPLDEYNPISGIKNPGAIYEYQLYESPEKPNKITTTVRINPNQEEFLTTYAFTDGLGRIIQAKSPADDDPDSGEHRQLVSGHVIFNEQGQPEEQYHPFFIPIYLDADYEKYIPLSQHPTGYKTTLSYDEQGRPIRTDLPDGSWSKVDYYGPEVVSTIKNTPYNHIKKTEQDAYGNAVKIIEYDRGSPYATTIYSYDTFNNLIAVEDDAHNITSITYDSLGRKISIDDPDMGIWYFEYDSLGNLLKQTDAKGQVIENEYDELNRLVEKSYHSSSGDIIQPGINYYYDSYEDGSVTNCIGRLTYIDDESGRTIFYYDELGRETETIKTIDGKNYSVKRTYDALNRLTSITYPDGETIQYTYNLQGQINSVFSANTTYAEEAEYDVNGQLTHITYGNGTSTQHEYDPCNFRLTHIKTENNDGRLQNLSYIFDDIGNITNISDSVNTATQEFVYDGLSRLMSATGSYGTIPYSYDTIGNMLGKGGTSYTYGQGSKKPHALTEGSDGFKATYDENGNMIFGRDNVRFDYDCENRLTNVFKLQEVSIELQHGWNFISLPLVPEDSKIEKVLSSLTFGVDYIEVSRYNSANSGFEYYVNNSDFNQFDTMEYGRGYQIYVINPEGCTLTLEGRMPDSDATLSLKSGWNLIGAPTLSSIPIDEALSNLEFDIEYDQISRYDPTTNTYEHYQNDTIGDDFNLMRSGEAYFLYCKEDTSWAIPATTGNAAFVYDGNGGRVKQITQTGITTYIGSLYEVKSGGTKTKHIFLGSNRICSKEADSNLHYYHANHLGSPNVITDQDGNQAKLLEYRPFGDISRSEGTNSSSYKFTGKELDDATGLYFYGARYYDPSIGRFITADPTVQHPGDPQDLNRYSYCRNNPVNLIDPLGYGWVKKFWRSIVGIATTVISALAPPLAPAMWAINTAISAYTAIDSGNFGGFIGGVVGGMYLGSVGADFSAFIGASMGSFANSFTGGFIQGAVEFGMAGFGAGFAGTLTSGGSFSEAIEAGGMGAAIGGSVGGVMQGSYMAGWQDIFHGNSRAKILGKAIEQAKATGNWANVASFAESMPKAARRSWSLYHATAMHEAKGMYPYGVGNALYRSYAKMLRGNGLIPPDFNDAIYTQGYTRSVNRWTFTEDNLSIEKQEVWETTRVNWILDPRGYGGNPRNAVEKALRITW